MYQVESARTLFAGDRRPRAGIAQGVGRTVWLLGLTSLLTDLSSEMVATILPLYLIYTVGLSPVQFGVLDGLNNGAAGLVRLVGGGLGDRLRRHKEVAAAGYALSAIARPAFLLVGSVFSAIGGLVLLDRVGKGLRTAPRDALISLSTQPERLGRAFGVHRALDTAGAMLGPLAAFAILAVTPEAFDVVFMASFAVALVGVAVIVLLVEPSRRSVERERPSLSDMLGLVRLPRFRPLVVAATLLALCTISDAFVYLKLQSSFDFDPRMFPLLYVGTAATFMVLAVPLGRLADRIGRNPVFVGGYLALVAVYCLLLFPVGRGTVLLVLPLLGVYYAATDGVLAAAAASTLPANLQGTGLAFVSTFTSLARLLGSIAFGVLWASAGSGSAVVVFGAGLALALCVAFRLIGRPARV